jgi:hypothetical protein
MGNKNYFWLYKGVTMPSLPDMAKLIRPWPRWRIAGTPELVMTDPPYIIA